jgi:hypothetical protein
MFTNAFQTSFDSLINNAVNGHRGREQEGSFPIHNLPVALAAYVRAYRNDQNASYIDSVRDIKLL